MKIITWNINGIRAITGQNTSRRLDVVTKENKLFEYIRREQPDLIGLQETKADLEQINEELRYPEGYLGYYNSATSKKGYSGTVTFTKREPLKVTYGLGIERFDVEGRVVQTDFPEFTHFNIYFPKGYTDDPRLQFKMEFYEALMEKLKAMLAEGRKIIVSGDYNTAHKEIDLARPADNTNTSGFLAEEREALDRFLALGFVDAFREFEKDGNQYTWWSNRGGARERNVGWRIDYHFVSTNLLPNLKSAAQHPDAMGSDHCPVVIELEF